MSLINKLDETNVVFNKLDELILSKSNKYDLKQHLLSISKDLAKYKEIDKKNVEFGNDQVKHKITAVLNIINKVETNVRNKLVITEKYNSYLKS